VAHIRRHPKSPDRWQVRYVDPTGRERSKNFSKKSEAEKFLYTVEADKLRGVWVDPQHGRIAFGDWAAQVEATRLNRRASTRARDASYLRSLILPTFNGRQLGAIQPNAIREWIADLEDRGYAPATIAKAYQIVSRCFRVAVSDGVIPRTPCREIKLPTNDRDEKRFLSPTEVEQLAAAIRDRYRLVVLTGAYTGLRFGELAALRLDDLDLLRRTLRVDEQLSRQGSSRITPGPLKSKKAYRDRDPGLLGRGAGFASDGVSVIDGFRLFTRVGWPARLRALSTPSLAPCCGGLGRRALHSARPSTHSCRHAHRRRPVPAIHR